MGVQFSPKSAVGLQTGNIAGAPLGELRESKKPQALKTPDLPETPAAPKAHALSPASLMGRLRPAVAGVLIAATLGSGCAMAGPPITDLQPSVTSPVAVEYVMRADRGGDQVTFNREMARLESMYAKGEITADQMAMVRGAMYRAHVLGFTEGVPKDERGRITIESVLRGDAAGAQQDRSKGQIVMDQLSRDIELRMRITARDMARGNFTQLEGMPGYKEIPASEVKKLLTDALERMPIGELPFGAELTRAIDGLPGTEGVDVATLSYKELTKVLRDGARERFDARYGEFIDDHKIELGVTAFAAITGLRAASPEAAKLMDQLNIRVRAWKVSTDDGHFSSTGRIAYRDAHILPDVDFQLAAHAPFGEHTTLRAGVDGTLSLEGHDRLTATATVGAHYTNDPYWADLMGAYDMQADQWRASASAGYANPDTTFRWSAGLDTTFGEGVARGDAPGRGTLHLDLGQELDFGRGVTGYWGGYAGASADSDLRNDSIEAGVVFRLTW